MPWFLVDDHFHSHPGVLKLLATKPEALGLWAAAGSWSSMHLTNGVIRDDVLPQLFPDAATLAKALTSARLWRRVRGAYEFIQEGTCKIPSREAVENERRNAAGRKRRQRERTTSDDLSTTEAQSKDPVDNTRSNHEGTRKPSSDGNVSRRDNAVSHGVSHGAQSNPDPSPVADVVNQGAGGNARASPDVIDVIIKEVLDVTGRSIDEDWAQLVARNILAGRVTASPVAYVRKAIRSEPNPRVRFLPQY